MERPPREYRIISSPSYNIKAYDYWGDCYESIFIMFKPFFKFKLNSDYNLRKFNEDRSKMLSILLNECEPVQWKEIKTIGNFFEYGEIDDGLTLNSYNPENRIKLEKLSNKLEILYPFEDFFSPFQVNIIQESFKYLGYKDILVGHEFPDAEKPENFNVESSSEELIFTSNIYSKDHKILFTSAFDCHYSFICSERQVIEELKERFCIEGFYCDKDTTTWWSRKTIDVEKFEV
ncbi:MAG: hypothetical protein ACO1OF_06515 [Adhaeribacter sp.]